VKLFNRNKIESIPFFTRILTYDGYIEVSKDNMIGHVHIKQVHEKGKSNPMKWKFQMNLSDPECINSKEDINKETTETEINVSSNIELDKLIKILQRWNE
jgi:hypothetical protein